MTVVLARSSAAAFVAANRALLTLHRRAVDPDRTATLAQLLRWHIRSWGMVFVAAFGLGAAAFNVRLDVAVGIASVFAILLTHQELAERRDTFGVGRLRGHLFAAVALIGVKWLSFHIGLTALGYVIWRAVS